MGWVAADDGLLAYDKNGDGVISGRDELSFVDYVPGARTDLEGLAHFDSNGDGRPDASDAEWGRFRVWRVLDQDGESDARELQTLAEAGITSIDLTSDGEERTVEGNTIFGEGSYTDAEGRGALYDAGLRYSEYGIREEADGSLAVSLAGSASVHVAGTETGVTLDATSLGVMGVVGHDGADRLAAGGDDGKALVGGGGDDTLEGGGGDDALDGGEGSDTAWYGGASSGVKASLLDASSNTGEASGDSYTGIENLYGSGFDDVLTGDGHANRLWGGSGADTLIGGVGSDVLTGGAGDDLFRFSAGDGADTITDFTDGEDRIDLRGHVGITRFGDLVIRQSGEDAGGGLLATQERIFRARRTTKCTLRSTRSSRSSRS